jgi:class 3 adenylate cyclase
VTAEGAPVARTFLIADIRGYTVYTREKGDDAAAALAQQFADIAREVVSFRPTACTSGDRWVVGPSSPGL